MSDPGVIPVLITVAGGLATMAIGTIAFFLKRMTKELDGKVSKEEFDRTILNIHKDLAKGHRNFKEVNAQLASMNTTLTAIAIKMDVADVSNIIKAHIERA